MTDIRQLWIDGFGCLRSTDDPFCFERERINLFVDENEAGKSTLQAALVAALYGVATDRRTVVADLRPRSEHYEPLDGPPFGLKLRIHRDSRPLEVVWTFGDECELYITDLGTNQDVTSKICPSGQGTDLGRRLLGLTFDEFHKTCLVRHNEMDAVRSPESLVALLERAADSQSGDTTVARAIATLRQTLRHYPGVMLKDGGLIENEIRRLEEDLEALRHELAQLEAEKEAIADQDAEFQRLAGERDGLLSELDRLEYLAHVAEHDELQDRIHRARQRQEVLARLQEELAQLGDLEGFPGDRAEQLTLWQAERQERLRDAAQAERSLAAQRDAILAPARRELDELGALGDVSLDDADRLSELLGRVRDFEAREQRLIDGIDALEHKLARQGASVEELDRLEDRFEDLAAADGQFLQDQEKAAARIDSETSESKHLALEAQLKIDQVREARQKERDLAHRAAVNGGMCFGAGAVLGIVLILLESVSAAFFAAGIAVLLGGVAAGGWLFYKGHSRAAHAGELREDELTESLATVARLETRQAELAKAQQEQRARLKDLARRYGYEQPEVLLEDYLSLEELRRQCADFTRLRGQMADMAGERESVQSDVADRLADCGRTLPHGQPLSKALEDLQTSFARARTQRQVVEETTRKLEEESQRIAALRERADELTANIRTVLADAGLAEAEDVDTALETFAERTTAYKRYHQLRHELIPQIESMVVDDDEMGSWKADVDRLHRAIATQREERPSLVSVVATQRAAEIRSLLGQTRSRLDAIKDEADAVGRQVVDLLNRYHAERPVLLECIVEREAQLARTREHRTSLEMAISVLDEIGHEVHGRWAEELNQRTSHLLERIAPTLRDLKFDSRLRFGVQHDGMTRPVSSGAPGPILSDGTWDQIYLAVRLGLADFVAQRRGSGLLIFDDPFITFDDERFEKALHVLAGLIHHQHSHQVVLFSCQKQRFQWLRERDPEWYDNHIVQQSLAAGRSAT